jgi:hypothetical protein
VADDPVTSALQREYDRYSIEIQRLFGQLERVVGLWITVVTIALGIGVKENIGQVFAIIPVIVLGLLFYAVTTHHFIVIGEGYASALEQVINERLGQPVLVFQTYLAPKFSHTRPALIITAVFGAVAAISIIGYALYRTHCIYPMLFMMVQLPLTVVSLVLASWSELWLGRLRQRVRHECLTALKAGSLWQGSSAPIQIQ